MLLCSDAPCCSSGRCPVRAPRRRCSVQSLPASVSAPTGTRTHHASPHQAPARDPWMTEEGGEREWSPPNSDRHTEPGESHQQTVGPSWILHVRNEPLRIQGRAGEELQVPLPPHPASAQASFMLEKASLLSRGAGGSAKTHLLSEFSQMTFSQK